MAVLKLSAVIISLNEERNIGRCIGSLLDVADEIVVLDAHSTDRTRDICLAAEVTFVQKEWQGYSSSKNYANSLASGDLSSRWMLMKRCHRSLPNPFSASK